MTPKKTPLNNGGKTARGKFAPGNKLGKGRPRGALNKVTLAVQNLLDGEAEELTRKAIELAKGGDMAALRLCFDRLLPPRKGRKVWNRHPPPYCTPLQPVKSRPTKGNRCPPFWKATGKSSKSPSWTGA